MNATTLPNSLTEAHTMLIYEVRSYGFIYASRGLKVIVGITSQNTNRRHELDK